MQLQKYFTKLLYKSSETFTLYHTSVSLQVAESVMFNINKHPFIILNVKYIDKSISIFMTGTDRQRFNVGRQLLLKL